MSRNWTEPRIYTDADNRPIRVTIYDKDDAREVASVRLSRDDGPEHVAQVKADFALIAQAPGMLHALKLAAKLIPTARRYFPKSIKNSDTFGLENTCATIGKAIHAAESEGT